MPAMLQDCKRDLKEAQLLSVQALAVGSFLRIQNCMIGSLQNSCLMIKNNSKGAWEAFTVEAPQKFK